MSKNKRIFDVVVAAVLLVLSIPLLLLIVIWIKIDSPGPIIFRQVRVGYRGKFFTILKFRTMRDGSRVSFDRTLPGDNRVTIPGKFLRKTHLDELPQLINVLCGQMSMVGPRPQSIGLVTKYIEESPSYVNIFAVLPGLTGLVQIHGRERLLRRGVHCVLRLERFYRERHSFGLDLYLLVRTVKTVFGCKGI